MVSNGAGVEWQTKRKKKKMLAIERSVRLQKLDWRELDRELKRFWSRIRLRCRWKFHLHPESARRRETVRDGERTVPSRNRMAREEWEKTENGVWTKKPRTLSFLIVAIITFGRKCVCRRSGCNRSHRTDGSHLSPHLSPLFTFRLLMLRRFLFAENGNRQLVLVHSFIYLDLCETFSQSAYASCRSNLFALFCRFSHWRKYSLDNLNISC